MPELGFNVMGTIWAFFDVIKCVNENDNFANTSIEGKQQKTPNFDLKLTHSKIYVIFVCLSLITSYKIEEEWLAEN